MSDTDGEVFGRYGIASQPAFAVIAPDGTVRVERGAVDGTMIDTLLSDAGA